MTDPLREGLERLLREWEDTYSFSALAREPLDNPGMKVLGVCIDKVQALLRAQLPVSSPPDIENTMRDILGIPRQP